MPEPQHFCDVPTCPHCGHEHKDTVGFDEPGPYECQKCGKSFRLEIEAAYTTWPEGTPEPRRTGEEGER